MSWLSRRRARPQLAASQLATAWQCVSLLMDYPGDTQRAQLPAIVAAAGTLPEAVRDPLLRLAGWLEASEPSVAEERYVATFDHTRRCALHLTYYAYGDTRKRGVALVRVKQAYRAAGVELDTSELPDHLCVVCEFGATASADAAWSIFTEYRPGLEILRLALADAGSPWLDGVLALLATLPPLDGDGTAAVAKLLAEGPPGEEVGMDAYALDPLLNPHPDADAAAFEGAHA